MGTSGNRPSYKIFSINTSIRNPLRNIEFLEYFKPFDNKPFDSNLKVQYLFQLVQNGVYIFTNLSENVKDKIKKGIPLTKEETRQAFIDNPQATGFSNRVVTQLRSLKDQGFLQFVQQARGNKYAIYKITKLGHELLDNKLERSDIYCKSMIGMHGCSIIRPALFNKTRPFLNTLFVINEVNKKWKVLTGEEGKGILRHEFATFVLSMKDCDYTAAANNIIEYRKKFGKNENEEYIKDYCFTKLGLEKVKYDTLMRDYVDDVYRKFALTGLIRQRGYFKYIYIDFSDINYGKVNQILETYKDYSWQGFNSSAAYYDYLYNIKLPWLENKKDKMEVLRQKAKVLNVDISSYDSIPEIENILNSISAQSAIKKQVELFTENEIYTELLILSKDLDRKSGLESIPEPLRLEFLLALMLGKKFGAEHIVSNLIFNDEGLPISFAPAKKVDLVFLDQKFNLVIEATMIRDRTQQYNNETDNLIRHLKDLELRTDDKYNMSLVAPYIHEDVCDFFQYKLGRFELDICPLTIARFVELCEISENIDEFKTNYELFISALSSIKNIKEYLDFVNHSSFNFISNNEVMIENEFLSQIYSIINEKIKKYFVFHI